LGFLKNKIEQLGDMEIEDDEESLDEEK